MSSPDDESSLNDSLNPENNLIHDSTNSNIKTLIAQNARKILLQKAESNELKQYNFGEEVSIDESEPWLVSYADLMTLLFGFFAMLFSYASFEDSTTVTMGKNMASYFGGNYVASSQQATQQFQDVFKFIYGTSPYKNDVDLKVAEDGLEVTFITSVLYNSGDAKILPEGMPPIKFLIKLILDVEKNANIRIEGHTDDNPVSNSVFPSNWELSAARAAAVARLFIQQGFPENKLSIAGYGPSRPAYPNRDENDNPIPLNQAHNRRVVVKVILPKGQKKNASVDLNRESKKLLKK